ncbi:MAG: NTP transferase domain-containing protein [Pseudoclavibacter sp.]
MIDDGKPEGEIAGGDTPSAGLPGAGVSGGDVPGGDVPDRGAPGGSMSTGETLAGSAVVDGSVDGSAERSADLGDDKDAPLASIVLAGGRAKRLGGTSKALMRIQGRPALARVIGALIERARTSIAVVGPADHVVSALRDDPASPGGGTVGDDARRDIVRVAIEGERFGGPAVAVAAGVAELLDAGVPGEALVDVLPCDLVRPARVVAALDDASRAAIAAPTAASGDRADVATADSVAQGDEAPHNAAPDGVMLVDADGREQWLATRIRLDALNAALADAAPGDSLRHRLGSLDLVRHAVSGDVTPDIDSPADVAAYGALVHLGTGSLCI